MRLGSRVRSYWRSRAKESSFGSKGVGGSREERLVGEKKAKQVGGMDGMETPWFCFIFSLDCYCE